MSGSGLIVAVLVMMVVMGAGMTLGAGAGLRRWRRNHGDDGKR